MQDAMQGAVGDGVVPRDDQVLEPAIRHIMGVVERIVDHPEDVRVTVACSSMRVVVELFTHPVDVGQVIGRSGHLISSLRALLTALAGKHGVSIDLDYVTEQANKARMGRAHRG